MVRRPFRPLVLYQTRRFVRTSQEGYPEYMESVIEQGHGHVCTGIMTILFRAEIDVALLSSHHKIHKPTNMGVGELARVRLNAGSTNRRKMMKWLSHTARSVAERFTRNKGRRLKFRER